MLLQLCEFFVICSIKMVSSFRKLLTTLLLIFTINDFQSVDGSEIYLQQVDVKTAKRVAGVYNIPMMRIIKFNRTAYVLNAKIEMETDIDNTYSVKIFFSLLFEIISNSYFK